MKKITFNKVNRKTKLLAILGSLIVFVCLLIAAGKAVNDWYNTHTLVFKPLVEVKFNKPITIAEREVQPREVIQVIQDVPEYKDLTDIEKYICDKWGQFKCSTAIAIFKAESGLREDAFNAYNTNGTIDVGIAQINSVHFGQPGCSLKEIVDAKKNVDCAYKIYEASGWSAWSAFNSGNFKDKLTER